MMQEDILKTLAPLEPLDLSKHNTIGAMVTKGYPKCSFGARNVGEVACTIMNWIEDSKRKPVVIFEDESSTRLGQILRHMYFEKKWLRNIFTLREYADWAHPDDRVIVVGNYLPREAKPVYDLPDEQVIFINNERKIKPGKRLPGYLPNIVFADPKFIVPLLFWTLREHFEGKPISARMFIDDLAYYRYGGVANRVAHGAVTLRAMIEHQCRIFLTLSGAMTAAQMGLLICDMLDSGKIACATTTGALISHNLVQSVGLKHYKHDPLRFSNADLSALSMNLIYDTYEPESNFDHGEAAMRDVYHKLVERNIMIVSTTDLNRRIGEYLCTHYSHERGILKSAYQKNIPVIIPAPEDAEATGNCRYLFDYMRNKSFFPEERTKILFDQQEDLDGLIRLLTTSERNAIFSIGGGTPFNYMRNALPVIESLNRRLGWHLPERPFVYSCRIDPALDMEDIGSLGGSPGEEGISWRKVAPHARISDIPIDATIAWPPLWQYLKETVL